MNTNKTQLRASTKTKSVGKGKMQSSKIQVRIQSVARVTAIFAACCGGSRLADLEREYGKR